MKRKLPFVLFGLLLLAGYLLLTSNSGGITGVSTTGCTCHGSASSNTTTMLSGLPLNGWVAGTTYTLTLTVSNSTKVSAGFDFTVDKGTFSNAPTGTAITSTNMEIRHTSPKTISSGSTSWTFNWTAPTTSTSTLAIFKVSGLAANGSGNFNGDEWSSNTFTSIAATTSGTAPTIVLQPVSGLSNSAATINASANANGASTSVTAAYGTTMALGTNATVTPAMVNGSSPTSVSAALSGLQAATKYYYRFTATNTAGTTQSAIDSFTTNPNPVTIPTIIINSVTNITSSGATVNGMVNANGASTGVTVEYGLTTSYGSNLPTTPNTVNGTTSTAVLANISGLLPNTVYNYRIVATNSAGTAQSPNGTFTTGPSSIADIDHASITLHPNPTHGYLQLKLPVKSNSISLKLVSLAGVELPIQYTMNGMDLSMQVDVLPVGYYMIYLELDKKVYSARFVKN